MALTLTRVPNAESVAGNKREAWWDITFDSGYTPGGESLTAAQLGLVTVLGMDMFPSGSTGMTFAYDRTNAKLRALLPAGPLLVTEATGTFTAGAAYTLKQLPGYILSIRGTAGATGAKSIIPVGETASTAQVAVNYTTGVLTWGDAAITAATILYIPLGAAGFTSDLLVVDEASTIASNVITLTNRAMAIQYVWNDEDNELLVPVTDNVALSGAQCHVDITNAGATEITVTSSRISDGSTGKTKVTYLKYTGNPLFQLDQQDVTVTSNVAGPGTMAAQLGGPSLLLPAYGVHLAVSDNTGPAQRSALLQDPAGTSAAAVCVWTPEMNQFAFNSSDSDDVLEMPFVLALTGAGGASREVPDGTNLASVTLRVRAIGF